MHRFITRRVTVSLAASALLASAALLATTTGAQASPFIDADDQFCNLDYAAAAAVVAPAGYEKILGTPDSDNWQISDANPSLQGGSGNEIIWGFDGDDEIAGGGGDDIICGGEGADLIRGGSGSNHLVGGGGADQMKGGSGTDYIYPDAEDTVTDGRGGFTIMCSTGTEC